MPEWGEDSGGIVITERIIIPRNELTFSFARSSGAGGQNVNKVNSKAILRWNFYQSKALPADVQLRFIQRYKGQLTVDGDLVLASDRFRDQPRNTADCIEKLKEMILLVAVAPKARKKTRPTKSSQRKRLDGKRLSSEKKQGRGKVKY